MTRALTFLLLGLSAFQAFAAVDGYPIDRRGGLGSGASTNTWYDVGIPGGIPDTATLYSNITTTGFSATILNNALASCPSNQYVMLSTSNGLYNCTGTAILIAKNGVELRGVTNANGHPTCTLSNTYINISKSQWPSAGSWGNLTSINVSSGLTEGSTSITLASSANSDFAVGDLFIVDQLYDGTNVKDSSLDWAHRPDRAYVEVLRATNISGATIQFEPPLLGTYWNGAQDPEAFGWSTTYGATLIGAGLRDVIVVPGNGGGLQNIIFGPAFRSYVKNISTTDWPTSGGASGIRLAYSAECEIRNSVFHDLSAVVNSSYAVYPTVVTGCAIENNIFTNLGLALPCISAVGCSFSYNYFTGPYPYSPSTFAEEYIFPHGGHSHHTLIADNWLELPIVFDQIFGGNNSRFGLVRNRAKGWATGKTGNLTPIKFEGTGMNYVTMLGNILGENSIHTAYSEMYSLDTATGTILTNNFGNYTGISNIVNVVETLIGNTIANSYRYASKPAWFGTCPWPPLVPPIHNTYGYTNLPAGYRAQFGTWPPASPSAGPTIAIAQTVKAGIVIFR